MADGTEECLECGKRTNKFVAECEHCGCDRWRDVLDAAADESGGRDDA